MVLTKRIYFLISIPLIMLILATTLCAALIWRNNRITHSLINEIVIKQNIMLTIESDVGYAGGIHYFKNLVLRRDLSYYLPAKKYLDSAIASCDKYLNLDNVEESEAKAIKKIRTTLTHYLQHLDLIPHLIREGSSIAEIDSRVKIDDTQAIKSTTEINSLLEEKRINYMQKFYSSQLNILILLSLLFLAILILSILLTKTVQNRIQKIIDSATHMAHEVASGNYFPEVDTEVISDVDFLFQDIQSMAKNIKNKVDLLQTRNSDLQQFTFIAAHDLREPINKIIAYTDLLLSECAELTPERLKIELAKILDNSMRLEYSVKDLLMYADMSVSTRSNEKINLSDSLKSAIHNLKPLIESSNCQIEYPPLPEIYGNRAHFEKVFTNIISNSIKFMRPGRSPEINISVKYLSKKTFSLTIEDNGIGFDQNLADQITRPFVKLSPKSQSPGSGIGLAMCARILQIYDSHLNIQSKPGQGTIISFDLHSIISENHAQL